MSQNLRFFATTAKEMEPLLAQELATFGAKDVRIVRAGAEFSGTLETAYRACMWSRIANRVLLPLRTFPAATVEALYGGTKGIRWSDHLTPEKTLAVDFQSSRSDITHTHFGALKVKDAIVDQLRSVQGERPSVSVQRPDVRVNVYLHDNEATVSIDLSGESLHRRGYRDESVPAPLKENLAAALLMHANWVEVAKAGGVLMDPMCGSGTIPIEAAHMAARIAPGLLRDYHGFVGWKGHDAAIWEKLCEQARNAQVKDKTKLPRIVGYDRDARAVTAAIAHVKRAGVQDMVHIEKREFDQLEPVLPYAKQEEGALPGIILINPPYGERLGEEEELKSLYSLIGDTFKKKFPGWEGYVFTGSPVLAKEVGLKASRRFPLWNGAIECRLFKYELFGGSRRKTTPAE